MLFVTTSENRLLLLREKLASVKGFELVAFATASGISSQNMVFGEVWYASNARMAGLLVEEVDGIKKY